MKILTGTPDVYNKIRAGDFLIKRDTDKPLDPGTYLSLNRKIFWNAGKGFLLSGKSPATGEDIEVYFTEEEMEAVRQWLNMKHEENKQ